MDPGSLVKVLSALSTVVTLRKALVAKSPTYTWTPELAQQQADDQTTGAFIQPHSWWPENGHKDVYDVDPRKLKPTEELSFPGNVPKIVEHIRAGKPLPPIYVDAKGKVIDGHHRLAAAKKLRLATVPTIRRNY